MHATHKVPPMGWEGLCKRILIDTVGHLMHPEQRRLEALAEGTAATAPASGGSGTVAHATAITAPASGRGRSSGSGTAPQATAVTVPASGGSAGSGTVAAPASGGSDRAASAPPPPAPRRAASQPPPPPKPRDAALQASPPPEPRPPPPPRRESLPAPPPPLPKAHQERAELRKALPAPRTPPKQPSESVPKTPPHLAPASWPLPPKRSLVSDSPSEAPHPLAQSEPQSQTAQRQPGVHELSSVAQVESAQASGGAPASDDAAASSSAPAFGGVGRLAWDTWGAEGDGFESPTPTSPVDPPPSPLPGSISHTLQMLSEKSASCVKAAPLQPVATSAVEAGASCADFEDFRTQNSRSGCGGWVSEVCVGAGTS